MINITLSDILTNLAEIKKASPGSLKPIRSLMEGARTLRDDPRVIEDIISGKNPAGITGVDSYIFNLVTEYIRTGEIKEYNKFLEKYSKDLLAMIRITGLGARRMFSIYDRFGCRNLEDLRSIFSGKPVGRVIEDAGFDSDVLTPFYVKRLKKGIDYYIGLGGLISRGAVESLSGKIKKNLENLSTVSRVEITGSLRRKKTFIGDMDFLIVPAFNENSFNKGKSMELLKDISRLEGIKKLKKTDLREASVSAAYETVHEVDVEVVIGSGPSYAWDLLYTTGSRKHLKELEEYAVKCGKDAGTAFRNSFNAASEEGIYGSLGMEYIVPELREGRGEIEKALKKTLPDLIRYDDIKCDLHVHSSWSDGLISYEEMISKAKELGYEYLAVSDHSVTNEYGHGLDVPGLFEKMEHMRKLNTQTECLEIITGAEIDIISREKLDYGNDIISKLDVAIASLHSSHMNTSEKNTDMVVNALNNEYVDFIGHPTGSVFGYRAPMFLDLDRVMEVAAATGKALEINSYFLRYDLNEENAAAARRAGVLLTINTDSHRPKNLDLIRHGVDIARRAGLKKEDVINTYTLKEFRQWRKFRGRSHLR
ncbi:MAG: PHP domain-containing protein [Actinobacteria bacterium]|nr:PHP domain-containing protein [Actinomycetota bacterium]